MRFRDLLSFPEGSLTLLERSPVLCAKLAASQQTQEGRKEGPSEKLQ